MKAFILICISIVFTQLGQSQDLIQLDEKYEDWMNVSSKITDPSGDHLNGNVDLLALYVSNDEDNLYFYIGLGQEINIQNDNDLRLYIDYDNDSNTGFEVDGLGAELSYFLGERRGFYYGSDGINRAISHPDIGIITIPTVTSNIFEISIKRKQTINGNAIQIDSTIKILVKDAGLFGDQVPDLGTDFLYQINEDTQSENEIQFTKNNTSDLRVLSYNVLRDKLFESSSTPAFQRILKMLDPDILAFQEIYNHSSAQTAIVVEQAIPLADGEQWYHAQNGNDIRIVSKYPIIKQRTIDGNAAFVIDKDGQQILLINAHLPCCENDDSRQDEIDFINAVIRVSKEGIGLVSVEEDSPIIVLGDMNLVGSRANQQNMISGNIEDEATYGADLIPDWDGAPFADAKPFATGTSSTITWDQPQSAFGPGRLDYILFSSSVMDLENSFSLHIASLSDSILIAQNLLASDAWNSSDHLPVIADFSLHGMSAIDKNNTLISNFKIYPSIAEQTINIKLNNFDIDNNYLMIYSTSGQFIEQITLKNSSSIQVDISNYIRGNYYIQLMNGKNNLKSLGQFLKI